MPDTLPLLLAFALTVAPIVAAPGTSTLLVGAEALRGGWRRVPGVMAGDLSANVAQMATVGLLLAAYGEVRSTSSLAGLRWVGVAYLVVLGISRLTGGSAGGPAGGVASGFVRGFLVSAANPKALVFFAGLFPAFLRPAAPILPQLVGLGLVWVALDALSLVAYAAAVRGLGARRSACSFRSSGRVAGGLLLVAALFLATR